MDSFWRCRERLLRSLRLYIPKQLFFKISLNSRRIFTWALGKYFIAFLLHFKKIIVNYDPCWTMSLKLSRFHLVKFVECPSYIFLRLARWISAHGTNKLDIVNTHNLFLEFVICQDILIQRELWPSQILITVKIWCENCSL